MSRSYSGRVYVICRRCGDQKRTRKKSFIDSGVCDECVAKAVMRNVLVKAGKPAPIEWTCMRERWFHELIYRQVEQNGLDSIGLGRLSFVDESQRSEKTLGRFRSTNANEYDLLLLGEKPVCVEVKRSADENSVAQVLRYRHSLKDDGFLDPVMVLLALEIPAKTMDVIDELRSSGMDIRVFRIGPSKSGFILERIDSGERRG